ncbi:hypothetical protein OIU84_018419 [Salix udensis]|uniref:DUF1977 domain-containing protein n=1 Tax=Salix udensis TaxID=889485 RepID=A0AAD6KWQ0_9ROSI|nr:hypothetical protein OIU84_018419 [Salix udensis]
MIRRVWLTSLSITSSIIIIMLGGGEQVRVVLIMMMSLILMRYSGHFFGQAEVFRARHVYRNRGMDGQQRGEQGGGPNLIVLLQILPFLLIILLAYLPFSEPEYSFTKNVPYQFPVSTEKYGVEYFVKSSAFDKNFPPGSPARNSIEDSVIKDYRDMIWRYCNIEIRRRQWNRNMPTPNCDKLRDLGFSMKEGSLSLNLMPLQSYGDL